MARFGDRSIERYVRTQQPRAEAEDPISGAIEKRFMRFAVPYVVAGALLGGTVVAAGAVFYNATSDGQWARSEGAPFLPNRLVDLERGQQEAAADRAREFLQETVAPDGPIPDALDFYGTGLVDPDVSAGFHADAASADQIRDAAIQEQLAGIRAEFPDPDTTLAELDRVPIEVLDAEVVPPTSPENGPNVRHVQVLVGGAGGLVLEFTPYTNIGEGPADLSDMRLAAGAENVAAELPPVLEQNQAMTYTGMAAPGGPPASRTVARRAARPVRPPTIKGRRLS